MNFQHLQYVTTIEACGSISKAANKLYLSQPYISRVLHELEHELGIIIFERGNDGVNPTEAGAEFLVLAKKLLKDMDSLQNLYKNSGQKTCRFTLSITRCSHGMDALVRMLEEIKEEEKIQFNIRESTNSEVINDIYGKVSELGLVCIADAQTATFHHLLKTKGMASKFVCRLEPMIILRKNHPLLSRKKKICLDDLYEYGFVLDDTSDFDLGIDMLSYYHLVDMQRIQKKILVNSRSALHNLLTRTDYVGVGIKSTLDQDTHLGIVSIPVEKEDLRPDLGSAFYLVWLNDTPESPAARLYIDRMMECYGDQ